MRDQFKDKDEYIDILESVIEIYKRKIEELLALVSG